MRRSLPFYLLLMGVALLVTIYVRLVVVTKPEDFYLHADAPLWVFLHMLLAVSVIDWLDQRLARHGRKQHRAGHYVRLLMVAGAVFLGLLMGLAMFLKLLDPYQPFEVEWSAYALLRYFSSNLVLYLLVCNTYLLFRYFQAGNAVKVQLQTVEKERARAELRAVQQHINPHFLFNNLNVLSALIEPTNDCAHQYLGHLSALYRHLLRHHEQEMIPLRDELAFADDFMYLLQIRFGAAYRFEKHILNPELLAHGLVPPAVLQELLTNAVKHNDASPARPLTIRLTLADNMLQLGNELRAGAQATGAGTGLATLRARVALLTDVPVRIEQTTEYFAVLVPITRLATATL